MTNGQKYMKNAILVLMALCLTTPVSAEETQATAKDPERVDLLKMKYDGGDLTAGLVIGFQLFLDGQVDESIRLYSEIASKGNPKAARVLADYYKAKDLTEISFQKSAEWYEIAANNGDSVAHRELGKMYATGIGKPKNYIEAEAHFREAWKKRDHIGGYNLALMELSRNQSVDTAVEILSELSTNSYPPAQYSLGKQYLDAAPKSLKGIELIRKAADAGYPPAQYNMGKLFKNGEINGTPEYTEAVQWFRKSATAGYHKAQEDLGRRYIEGQGVEADLARAAAWLKLAVEGGNTDAAQALANINSDSQNAHVANFGQQVLATSLRKQYELDSRIWSATNNRYSPVLHSDISIFSAMEKE